MSLDETSLSDTSTDASDRLNPAQPESRHPAQSPSWGAKRCPSCTTPVRYDQIVCAECGTRLIPRLTKVRCRRCGKRATSDHVICPQCGRELRAAPSRLLTIGAPALLVGALAIAFIVRGASSFLEQNGSLPLIQNFVITPVSPADEPTVGGERESLTHAIVPSRAGLSDESSLSEGGFPTPTPTQPEGESNTAANVSAGQVAPQDTAPLEETGTEIATPPADAPTETVAANEEEPTPTPTTALFRYTIQDGDTIVAIAQRYGISYDTVLDANNLTERSAANLQIGRKIVLPGVAQATATPAATPSATPTATEIARPRPTSTSSSRPTATLPRVP